MYLRNVILVALVLAMAAGAQTLAVLDAPYQVRYAANLNQGESFINIINDGANGTSPNGPGLPGATGNLCINVYAFDPNEEMIGCCSCTVTPDQVVNLGVNRDILSNTQTGVTPTSVTIKLLATLAGAASGGGLPGSASCQNSAATLGTNAGAVVAGFVAFGTTLHAQVNAGATTYVTTETPFIPATLSAGETAGLSNRCTGIIGNSSNHGICAACRPGALGASKM